MAGGPAVKIPFDLSSLTNAAEKAKTLRKEVKQASKEVDAYVKKGQAVPADAKQRFQVAQRSLNDFTARIRESQSQVRRFIDGRIQAQQKQFSPAQSVLNVASRVAGMRAVINDIKGTMSSLGGERMERGVMGQTSSGEDIYHKYDPSRGYRNAEMFNKGADYLINSKNPVAAAIGVGVKAVTSAAMYAENVQEGKKLNAIYKQQASQEFASSGVAGAFGNQADVEAKLHQKYRDQNSLLGQIDNGTKTLFGMKLGIPESMKAAADRIPKTAEEVKAEHSAKTAALNELGSLHKEQLAKIDMGDFIGSQQKMKQIADAARIVGLEVPQAWRNPAEIYTMRESAKEASKAWARNNMAKAANRSGD